MAEFIYARNFKELVAYQVGFDLSRRVFELSKAFPEEEKFSLTSQIRRSSRSIGAQIAEAWAKRKYERHFVSKLTDANGDTALGAYGVQLWLHRENNGLRSYE